MMLDKKKGPVAPTTKAQPKTVEANGNGLIAHDSQTDNQIVIETESWSRFRHAHSRSTTPGCLMKQAESRQAAV